MPPLPGSQLKIQIRIANLSSNEEFTENPCQQLFFITMPLSRSIHAASWKFRHCLKSSAPNDGRCRGGADATVSIKRTFISVQRDG
jgi:hypothetical protein